MLTVGGHVFSTSYVEERPWQPIQLEMEERKSKKLRGREIRSNQVLGLQRMFRELCPVLVTIISHILTY